jgi:hypothetical protein
MANEEGNVYRVKLVSQRTVNEPIRNQERVVFNATPELSENRTVNYSTVEPVHMPGQIFVYKNVSSRTFSISNIRLISRNAEEAEANLELLWILRSWTMPRFGNSSTLSTRQAINRTRARRNNSNFQAQLSGQDEAQRKNTLGVDQIGAPPEVLLLSAYSKGINPSESGGLFSNQHINRVPVVIQTLTIPYPSDIDYIISSETQTPMPTIMTLDMSLVETHSAREYEQFSLDDFRHGNLIHF